MKIFAVAASLAAILTQPVRAQPADESLLVDLTRSSAGYTYFNRTGATLAEHDAALRSCIADAGRMRQPDQTAPSGGGLLGALVLGMLSGAVNSMQERRGMTANVENCMVVAGWRVVRLDPVIGETLDKLEQPALHEALADYVGTDVPRGEVVRVFANDAADGRTRRLGPAGDLDKVALSIQALPPLEVEPVAQAPKLPRAARTARPPRALEPENIKPVDGMGLITVRLVGQAEQGGLTLLFTRAGPDMSTPAWVVDQQPSLFWIGLPYRGARRGDTTRAVTQTFAVPPGRWRLSAMQQDQRILHFCLGSPAFELAAGSSVFAGTFDLSGEQIGPNLELTPDLLPPGAVERGVVLEAAVYSGLDREECQGAYLYTLQVPEGALVARAEGTSQAEEPVASSGESAAET